jgi:hypothetical protein
MKMLFKEFFQLDEMPHLGIATGAYDYELEHFTPPFKSEEERIQK